VTDPLPPDTTPPEDDDVDDVELRLSWEVPEIIGVAVVAVVGLLAAGGLGTGIARSVEFAPPNGYSFPGASLETWNAVQFGAQWASPLIAALLLGVLGLCWWQLQAWSEVIESPDSDDDVAEATGHMRRARRMARWTAAALLLTGAGSIAGFAAAVGANVGEPGGVWSIEIYAGAYLLAVLVLLAAAVVVRRHLGLRYGAAVADDRSAG
jgi:hypothetical protein